MNAWSLPTTAKIGGRSYKIHADYRDVLYIIQKLNDASIPEHLRWRIAVALFYEEEPPREDHAEAMEYLSSFITCGEQEEKRPGPVLIDWGQDAMAIVADVNKVAGKEVRGLTFLHWWTFVAYFHAIGEGQLSTVVSIRDKLARGKKLEDWEKEYYKKNKTKVDLKKRVSSEEQESIDKINRFLNA